jgi:hypothetical protein
MELDKVRAAHVNQERTVEELKALLEHYQMLYENRFYVDTDKKSLIAAGYYGATIQRWFK